jgi:hypothetical protein
LIGPEIIERLVDDRQTDDGIDEIRTDVPVQINPKQHRRRMFDSEQTYVKADIFEAIEKKDNAE